MLSVTARYFAALAVLAVGDVLWLRYFSRTVVEPALKPILREHIDWRAAIAFYLLYAAGIAVFAISPALTERSARLAFVYGLLFGFFAYMTYDLTNYATLKFWTVKLAVMDIGWGTLISGVAGLAGYGAARAIVNA